jgi:Tfp pilus assembly protein PilV
VNALRDRLRLDVRSDRGLGLVEVVVSMVLFAMISTGVIAAMISILSVSRDTRARQVATNLAAEEIDRARAVEDVLALESWSTAGGADPNDASRVAGPVELNGDLFHITRQVAWVSDPDATLPCGASADGSTLRYKRVNIRVTWDGMRSSAAPVQSDSVINPRDPLNDPTKGTILVTVLTAGGTGAAGVTVTIDPPLPIAPSPTDADGCSYLFKVPVGGYTIGIHKPGFVDETNNVDPATEVGVDAGEAEHREFAFDEGGIYNLQYPAPTGFVRPSGMDVSFLNTKGLSVWPANHPAPHLLHPGSPYTIVAGDAETCPAANPGNWVGGGGLQPPEVLTYMAAPGASIDVPVPLVPFEVRDIANNRHIRAFSVDNPDGHHAGCLAEKSYSFPLNEHKLSLPYGTWLLYEYQSSTRKERIVGVDVAGPSQFTATDLLVLDPRVVAPVVPAAGEVVVG